MSLRIGTTSMPGIFIGMRKKLSPSYLLLADGFERASRIMYFACLPRLVQILLPLRTNSLPSRSALSCALPKSEP